MTKYVSVHTYNDKSQIKYFIADTEDDIYRYYITNYQIEVFLDTCFLCPFKPIPGMEESYDYNYDKSIYNESTYEDICKKILLNNGIQYKIYHLMNVINYTKT